VRSRGQSGEIELPHAASPATPSEPHPLAVPSTDASFAEPAPAPSFVAVEVLAPTEETHAPDQPLTRTESRALRSAADQGLMGTALRVPAAEPAGPSVHIGIVEVEVAAPVEKRAPAAAPASPSNLASRRYLRSL
jgi:hypothetical protein